jgi:ABC-type cobalamin transport system permease subunit
MNYFKIFCLQNFDDSVATNFSSFSTIILLVSQVFYGFLMDYKGWKWVVCCLLGSLIIALLLLQFGREILSTFYLSYVIFYTLYGGVDI